MINKIKQLLQINKQIKLYEFTKIPVCNVQEIHGNLSLSLPDESIDFNRGIAPNLDTSQESLLYNIFDCGGITTNEIVHKKDWRGRTYAHKTIRGFCFTSKIYRQYNLKDFDLNKIWMPITKTKIRIIRGKNLIQEKGWTYSRIKQESDCCEVIDLLEQKEKLGFVFKYL